MPKPSVRWSLFFIALLAVGPALWLLVGPLHASDGGPGRTPLLSQSPLIGGLRGFAAVIIACGLGLLIKRFVTPRWALFCTGLALVWTAFGTGTLTEILRAQPSERTLWMLGLEGLLFGIPVALLGRLVMPCVPHAIPRHTPRDRRPGFGEPTPLVAGTIAFIVALIGGAVAAWLIAQNVYKGQTVFAAIAGGLLGAMAGHLAAPSAPAWTFIAAIAALAATSPIAAALTEKGGISLLQAAYNATIFPPARILPLDWLAGGLIGVPLGLAWAAGFLPKKDAAPAMA